jgi:hypothetical protein
MNRTDVINFYLNKISGEKRYLEIGVRNRDNFNKIQSDHKDGVDPNYDINYKMTSDDFFRENTKKYDLIFVDGLHLYEQAYRDIINSLNSLNDKGVIIVHDCNPPSEWHQRENNFKGQWNGTTWKAFVRLRCERKDLNMFVIDSDWGIGVIDPKGTQQIFSCDENIYEYSVFQKYRKEALNLITLQDFGLSK